MAKSSRKDAGRHERLTQPRRRITQRSRAVSLTRQHSLFTCTHWSRGVRRTGPERHTRVRRGSARLGSLLSSRNSGRGSRGSVIQLVYIASAFARSRQRDGSTSERSDNPRNGDDVARVCTRRSSTRNWHLPVETRRGRAGGARWTDGGTTTEEGRPYGHAGSTVGNARSVEERPRDGERTRKSERARREIATLATTGATLLCTRSFPAKPRYALRPREKKYAPICYRPLLASFFSHSLSLYLRFGPSCLLFLSSGAISTCMWIHTLVATYVYVHARNLVCVHTGDGEERRARRTETDGRVVACTRERRRSETEEWEIIKMAARATYSAPPTPPPPPPPIPTILFLLFGRPTRRLARKPPGALPHDHNSNGLLP